MIFDTDKIVFKPQDVDLSFSPVFNDLKGKTYVLGAFNPGLTRLPDGNLLIMVRIAEALQQPIYDNSIHTIRWTPEGYLEEGFALDEVVTDDPREFYLKDQPSPVFALTSISWLLPVELSPDGLDIIKIHYDKIITPDRSSQEYGIEDARISFIDGKYYMTTCTVSSERHATTLFISEDGLNYEFGGILLDHQNKDMLLFEGKAGNKYYALTRPLGSQYLATGNSSEWNPGPVIQLATSPDLFHWKPWDEPFIRARKGTVSTYKIGGGTPPILTDKGWLMLYHGVESSGEVGIYRTFWALLDKEDPSRIIKLEDRQFLLEAREKLTTEMKDRIYLEDVVFSCGIADAGDFFIVASGELDLACRITHIQKSCFGL